MKEVHQTHTNKLNIKCMSTNYCLIISNYSSLLSSPQLQMYAPVTLNQYASGDSYLYPYLALFTIPPTPTLGNKSQNKGMEDIMDIDSHCPYLLYGETTFNLTSK